MRGFESRDVMVPVGVSESGELAWAAGDEKTTCHPCTECTNVTIKSQPKPKSLAHDLSALRAQLHALTTG